MVIKRAYKNVVISAIIIWYDFTIIYMGVKICTKNIKIRKKIVETFRS